MTRYSISEALTIIRQEVKGLNRVQVVEMSEAALKNSPIGINKIPYSTLQTLEEGTTKTPAWQLLSSVLYLYKITDRAFLKFMETGDYEFINCSTSNDSSPPKAKIPFYNCSSEFEYPNSPSSFITPPGDQAYDFSFSVADMGVELISDYFKINSTVFCKDEAPAFGKFVAVLRHDGYLIIYKYITDGSTPILKPIYDNFSEIRTSDKFKIVGVVKDTLLQLP